MNRLTFLTAGLTLIAGMAHAHATFEVNQAVAEKTFKAALQVPQNPAPTISVTLAGAEHAHGGHGGVQTTGPVEAGNLEISGGAVKAMLPGAKVGGGGFIVKNNGSTDDRLIAAESPAAGRVELHEMTMENDVMKMRKVEGGIAVPAGETVELKSGRLHLMFMEVKKPFAEGDVIPLTLTFEKAGKVDYALPVGSAAGGADQHKHE